jgi:hypothetical protein
MLNTQGHVDTKSDDAEFHRHIEMRDNESDEGFDARMIKQKGYVPTRRRIIRKNSVEQEAWVEENRMDAKRKAIEVELRTANSSFSRKRKFETITNLSTAIKDVDTAVDGRLLQLAFPEAPVDFVGYAGRRMSACHEEPGHTMIREYVDANGRHELDDLPGRVKMEVKEVVRHLFDEKPEQAETHLAKFLHETCLGETHDAKPFILHLEPFDIQASTLVCMLDSIYQQGKGQGAQLTELRNQNIEHKHQFKRQADQLQGQVEHNIRQEKKLKHLETHSKRQMIQLDGQAEQLDGQAEQLDDLQTLNIEQAQKLDQLLVHVQHLGTQNNTTNLLNSAIDPILGTDPNPVSALYVGVPKHRSLQSRAKQRDIQRATDSILLHSLFVIGTDEGTSLHDQLNQSEIMNKLETLDNLLTPNAVKKALTLMGATPTRQRQSDGSLTTIFKFIKNKCE